MCYNIENSKSKGRLQMSVSYMPSYKEYDELKDNEQLIKDVQMLTYNYYLRQKQKQNEFDDVSVLAYLMEGDSLHNIYQYIGSKPIFTFEDFCDRGMDNEWFEKLCIQAAYSSEEALQKLYLMYNKYFFTSYIKNMASKEKFFFGNICDICKEYLDDNSELSSVDFNKAKEILHDTLYEFSVKAFKKGFTAEEVNMHFDDATGHKKDYQNTISYFDNRYAETCDLKAWKNLLSKAYSKVVSVTENGKVTDEDVSYIALIYKTSNNAKIRSNIERLIADGLESCYYKRGREKHNSYLDLADSLRNDKADRYIMDKHIEEASKTNRKNQKEL